MSISIPGVPPLLNQLGQASATVALLTADVGLVLNPLLQQWGIFDTTGTSVINADSMVTYEYRQEWRLPNYPQEEGAFQTYNKVQMPIEMKVTLTKGGNAADRNTFLSAVESMAVTLNLYSIYTDAVRYDNMCVSHVDYRRSANRGKSLITVDIWFTEVRNTATASFSNVAAPSAASVQNVGAVQGQDVASQVASQIANYGM